MNNNRDEIWCWIVVILFAYIFCLLYTTAIDLGVNYFLGVN